MKPSLEERKMEPERARKLRELSLPATDTISEWFSQDQQHRLARLSDATTPYSKYSVYQVYSEHSKTL